VPLGERGNSSAQIAALPNAAKERFTVQVLNRKNITHQVQNMEEIIHKMFVFGIHS